MTDNRTTELLHKLLDERGVKWWEGEDERKTHWVANGLTWEYFNNENGDAWLGFLGACENDISPEQAIAATLGSGTCELKHASWDDGQCTWGCICSACDARFEHETGIGYNYCPNCGAKVIQGVDNADK